MRQEHNAIYSPDKAKCNSQIDQLLNRREQVHLKKMIHRTFVLENNYTIRDF